VDAHLPDTYVPDEAQKLELYRRLARVRSAGDLAAFRQERGFGRGISAIKIGEPLRIIYIELKGSSYSIINPAFERMSEEKLRIWDDCFSFPDLLVHVERSASASLRYFEQEGRPRTLEASGALSELLQHEMDHLDGILALDRAVGRDSFRTRAEHERQLLLEGSLRGAARADE